MHRQRELALGIALLVAVAGGIAIAQETPAPDAGAPATESTYFDLRRSKDRLTQQFAERYFSLVKLQEWSSDKGTKIKAKYVSHADDLKSVTLSVVKGTGAERVAKEVSVPVARLSKTSQSRVKQIATIQKKLDELITAGAKGEPGQPGETPVGDPGAPMVDEFGVQPPRRPPTARRPARPGREERPAERPDTPDASDTTAADDGDSDPLGFGELPANPATQVPPAGVEFPAAPRTITLPGNAVPEGTKTAKPTDKAAWRTDYAAFRANFKTDASRELSPVNWGALKELQAAAEVVKKWDDFGSVGEEAHLEIAKKFEEVGEFTWEATLTDADVSSGDWTERLNLPPLPAPLSIGFILDPDLEPGNWQRFKAGDRVRFVGRFIAIENGDDIVAAIRFPNDASVSGVTIDSDRPAAAR